MIAHEAGGAEKAGHAADPGKRCQDQAAGDRIQIQLHDVKRGADRHDGEQRERNDEFTQAGAGRAGSVVMRFPVERALRPDRRAAAALRSRRCGHGALARAQAAAVDKIVDVPESRTAEGPTLGPAGTRVTREVLLNQFVGSMGGKTR